MILFLDDDPNRAAIAYNRMTSEHQDNTIWCKTVEEAILTLKDYKDRLYLVDLDHDLEGKQYQHTNSPECGMEIVRWLEELARKSEKEFEIYTTIPFTIHSYNEFAAPEMVDRLQKIGCKAKWVPFGT